MILSPARIPLLLGAVLVAVAGPLRAQTPSRITLVEAMRLAARSGADPQVARLEAEEAGARVRTERAALLPSIDAEALQSGRSLNTATFGIDFPVEPGRPAFFDPNGQVVGPIRLLDLRLRGTMTLFDWSAILGVKSAAAAAEASGAEADVAATAAAFSAAADYLQVQRSEALVSARLADSLLADSLVTIARAQSEAGTAVQLDVTRAQSQVAAARADLIEARSTRDRHRLELRHAIGVSPGAPLELADALDIPAAQDTAPREADVIGQALQRRPEIRAASAELDAAEQSLGVERAKRLPTLEAFGDYGVVGKSTDHLLGTYDWGLQVSVPIFNGFEREGRIAEARARSRALAVRRQDLLERVALDVRSARLDLASAREQVDAARTRLSLARDEVSQARQRFENGLSGNADVITALLSLNRARTFEIDALTAYRSATLSLAFASGSLVDLR